LKLNSDEPLSNVAFNFNVRRHNMALGRDAADLRHEVGRCRLTVSKSVLKAHMVSAFETKIW
jgi:hypothetical protein